MNLLEEIRAIPSAPRDLRKFGFMLAAVSGGISLFIAWKGGAGGVWMGAAMLLAVPAACFPTALRPLQKIWMALALCLGTVMTGLLLTTLYYLVFTPLGFVLRCMGKDLLDTDPKRRRDTYWKDRVPGTREGYGNQF